MLHGRDAERARLVRVLLDARAGRAGTLLVHGEPGVGKSALLDDLVANAGSDVCILRTQGVESEAPLAFAALQRLRNIFTKAGVASRGELAQPDLS